eukprot:snap_masked-scaffold_59-processed-gene-0.24-mRNA-1 protein AED:1.00 eAED:1.00 QI:0/0/0/0/1/1/2/0/198
MKLQSIIAFLPLALSSIQERDIITTTLSTKLADLAMRNYQVSTLRQECFIVEDEETVERCQAPFNAALEAIIGDLSPDELSELNEILANEELSPQERSNQLFDLLGAPRLCIPDFIETLPFLLFCEESCEDGFCEANLESIEARLTQFAGELGCDFDTTNICEVFIEITNKENAAPKLFSEVGLGSLGVLIGLYVNFL